MQLFYQPNIVDENGLISFDKEESRHIVKVLRYKVGDKLMLTDGRGLFYNTEIVLADIKNCVVRMICKQPQQSLPYHLHLAVAPTKNNDRFEWFLEKATEIGISEITPLICSRSERVEIKFQRYEKVLISAMKQSLRAYLPKLNEATRYKTFITKKSNQWAKKFIAHCEDTPKISVIEWFNNHLFPNEIIILIGPEGDFSSEEIQWAKQNNYQEISLSNNRLRTETAAITATDVVRIFSEIKV